MDSLINTQNPADNILYKITTLDQIQNYDIINKMGMRFSHKFIG